MNEIAIIWERVNSLIKECNTTQTAISIQCGLNPRRVQNLSSGNRLPDAIEITKIAAALNTTVEYLINGKEQNSYKEKYDKLKSAVLEAVQNN